MIKLGYFGLVLIGLAAIVPAHASLPTRTNNAFVAVDEPHDQRANDDLALAKARADFIDESARLERRYSKIRFSPKSERSAIKKRFASERARLEEALKRAGDDRDGQREALKAYRSDFLKGTLKNKQLSAYFRAYQGYLGERARLIAHAAGHLTALEKDAFVEWVDQWEREVLPRYPEVRKYMPKLIKLIVEITDDYRVRDEQILHAHYTGLGGKVQEWIDYLYGVGSYATKSTK